MSLMKDQKAYIMQLQSFMNGFLKIQINRLISIEISFGIWQI